MSVFFPIMGFRFFVVLYSVCSFAPCVQWFYECGGTRRVDIDPTWLLILDGSNGGCRALFEGVESVSRFVHRSGDSLREREVDS